MKFDPFAEAWLVAAIMFVPAFCIAAVLGRPLVYWLRSVSYRQHAYEDAPQSHQKKTGTPTMGGLLFLLAPILWCSLWLSTSNLALAFLVIGSGAVGFIDDYMAVRGGRNRGLRARAKFLLTGIVGVVFLLGAHGSAPNDAALFLIGPVPTWVWYAVSLAVILATTHAVNLTDGLDGLASGTIVPPLLLIAFVALQQRTPASDGVAAAIAALIGVVLAFLIFYNRHPAKMFMGDTGSLALGGALAGVSILTGTQILLLLIGGVFVAETLSVIIQVTSYKTTRRRVFRMSPLHHHFELGGWPETRVTSSFWLASLCLGIIGFVIVVRA